MKMLVALVSLVMLAGCINIDTHLQPINQRKRNGDILLFQIGWVYGE
jgi:uncharacterized lipoprotein YajG